MVTGTVISIWIAAEAGGETRAVAQAVLVPGKGIEGDRYFRAAPAGLSPGQQITLVAEEQIAAASRAAGIDIEPADTRRNVITRGIDLNQLVGKRFRVGSAFLVGVELCEPCASLGSRLSERLGKAAPEIVQALVHRAGLRADIVAGGAIRGGDPVSAAPAARHTETDPAAGN